MRGVRAVLIGGTSNVGKSTLARAVAGRLGFECLSTDGLARHPGRPWRTPERTVPAHVADHYRSLTSDQLITSVLDHYERLWPGIEELVASHTTGDGAGPGLVLEGSALWPARVATLDARCMAAVWLVADDALLRARVHTASHYDESCAAERFLADKFLARTERYQELMLEDVNTLGLDHIDVGSKSVGELTEAILAVAGRGEPLSH